MTKHKITKKKKLTWHKNKAWEEFSRYIRRRDKGVCFTCGCKRPWKEQNAGHFQHGKLDFDEQNVNCQCVKCNKFMHGHLDMYAVKLDEVYGQGTAGTLIIKSNQIVIHTREDFDKIREYYRQKNEELKIDC
jgi:hypothetical protein